MQKLLNTNKKLLLAFFVSLTATGLRATTPNDIIIVNSEANQLTTMLNSMSPEDQEQFEKLLEEAVTISNNQPSNIANSLLIQLGSILANNVPYAKISGFCLRLALAIVCWEYIQPKLKEKFPGHDTATELPKLISAVFVIDDIKDFLKSFKGSTEEKCQNIYVNIVSPLATLATA